MNKEIIVLLDVANRKLAAKSILENHTIGYSEELDLFNVYVEINNIPMEKSLSGPDGDFVDETTLAVDVNDLADTLISFADTALLEIIYSN